MGGFPITALFAGGGIPAYSPHVPPAESEGSAGWAPEGFIPAACYGPLVYIIDPRLISPELTNPAHPEA